MTDFLVVGGGGHAKVVIAALLAAGDLRVVGFTDANPHSTRILGVPRLGDDDVIEDFARSHRHGAAAIGVGMVGTTNVRRRIEARLLEIGLALPVVRAPSSQVLQDVEVGKGSFIGACVVINPSVSVGRCAILNTRCVVEHDVIVGDHVHLSPGSILCGGSSVGNDSWIGAGAIVLQSVSVAAHCVVGAGAVVTEDLTLPGTYVGAPARRVSRPAVTHLNP